ncbi:MAG: hypothetical protein ABI210_06125, partial [Abditibacteriaceae bacterium]
RPRLAVVSTVYFPLSHDDVIITRWLEPLKSDRDFGWPANGFSEPRTDIAGVYIREFTDKDIGREILKKHNVPLYSTVREALTLGGDTLAVDGIILIGEHGTYPCNEFGQKMYPRRELFDEIVTVFKDSGRSVPVFNDKHFSYDAASALYMVETAKNIEFPLMAGSSIPICGTITPWLAPQDAELSEAVGLYYGSNEAYGYHSIAFLQSLIARRAGGEVGIKSVTAYCGDSFWEADKTGVWPADLLELALEESIDHEEGEWRENISSPTDAEALIDKWPTAYVFEHNDGFRSIQLNMNGHIKDWTVAMRDKNGTIYSGCSASVNNGQNNFYAHFAMLDAKIEDFMLTGKSPYPVEHYLLTTLAISAAIHAMFQPGVAIETPELALPYKL